MKPIKFPEQNCTFAENQPEYLPLPVFKDENGVVISCWKLSFNERIRVLFYGRLWQSMLSFNKPLTPSFLAVKKSDLFLPNEKQDNMTIKRATELFQKPRNEHRPGDSDGQTFSPRI